MKLNLHICFLSVCLVGCEGKSSVQLENTGLVAASYENDSVRLSQYLNSPDKPNEVTGSVTLSKCSVLHNDNLVPVQWVTVTNNTSISIKGIEVKPSYDQEPIKYKILLGSRSSKRLKTDRFNCNSSVVGIIFSNGEYKNMRSFEEQSGIDVNHQNDHQIK